MSIIITGLEMPTERESFNLTIMYNGTVLDTETGMQVAEAYELSPHGRLIDADALEYHADNVRDPMGRTEKTVMWNKIESAPTIIPAEEGE